MSNTVEVRVPDIGDFKDVPVIEVLVKAGDRVKKNDALVTLESDKASMEVPAESAGVVQAVNVKVGDKVSQGVPILTLQSDEAAAAQPAPQQQQPAQSQQQPAPQPPQSAPSQSAQVEVRVPDIGDFKDVPVIEVLVKKGDRVKKNDTLVTLESDKASMEVPSDYEGVVDDIRVKVGDKVSQGAAIAVLSTQSAPAPGPTPAPAQAPSAPAASPAAPPASTVATAPTTGNGMVHAGPSIRRFARELGVDLQKLRGTGPNGRITRDDVQGFVKRALEGGASAPACGIVAVRQSSAMAEDRLRAVWCDRTQAALTYQENRRPKSASQLACRFRISPTTTRPT